MKTFYLGVHHPDFLAKTAVPLFVSRRSLVMKGDRQRKTLPRALGAWALDSAGFTELNMFGKHHITPRQYAEEVCRYHAEIGGLAWASVQDWMVEPDVLRVTRKSVHYHQMKTIESLATLRAIAPSMPWAPVLQGWSKGEHEEHLALYHLNGFDLRVEPIVGVGSVCRRTRVKGSKSARAKGRQEETADDYVRSLSGYGLNLHLFGYKEEGLPGTLNFVYSADSMAWSDKARYDNILLEGCHHVHQHDSVTDEGVVRWRKGSPADCRNCLRYALHWREEILEKARREAMPDYWERHWGTREPTPRELEAFAAIDVAEGADPRGGLTGDYPWKARALELRSRRRVEAVPSPHFVIDPSRPCTPASYAPPQAARRRYQKDPPAIVLETLPAPGPRQPAVRAFVPWQPPWLRQERSIRRAKRPEGPRAAWRPQAAPLPVAHADATRTPFMAVGEDPIDPFRDAPASLRVALDRLGRATGMPWPDSAGRADPVDAVPVGALMSMPLADRSEGRGPSGEAGGWDHLREFEVIDQLGHYYRRAEAVRVSGWLRDGLPAVVVASGARGSVLVEGLDRLRLAQLLGIKALPVLRLAPRSRQLAEAVERLRRARPNGTGEDRVADAARPPAHRAPWLDPAARPGDAQGEVLAVAPRSPDRPRQGDLDFDRAGRSAAARGLTPWGRGDERSDPFRNARVAVTAAEAALDGAMGAKALDPRWPSGALVQSTDAQALVLWLAACPSLSPATFDAPAGSWARRPRRELEELVRRHFPRRSEEAIGWLDLGVPAPVVADGGGAQALAEGADRVALASALGATHMGVHVLTMRGEWGDRFRAAVARLPARTVVRPTARPQTAAASAVPGESWRGPPSMAGEGRLRILAVPPHLFGGSQPEWRRGDETTYPYRDAIGAVERAVAALGRAMDAKRRDRSWPEGAVFFASVHQAWVPSLAAAPSVEPTRLSVGPGAWAGKPRAALETLIRRHYPGDAEEAVRWLSNGIPAPVVAEAGGAGVVLDGADRIALAAALGVPRMGAEVVRVADAWRDTFLALVRRGGRALEAPREEAPAVAAPTRSAARPRAVKGRIRTDAGKGQGKRRR